MLSNNLLFSEGIYILSVLLVLLFIGVFYQRLFLFCGTLAALLFCFYFFRNPMRQCPTKANAIVAPADGTVIDISTNPKDTQGYAIRIATFLSLWDVHVQWTPIAGTVESVHYQPGKFSFAFLPKSSTNNERNDIVITSSRGQRIMVRQIAGILARRIACWVQEGEMMDRCAKIGMIRFGSRVELFLPKEVEVMIKKDDQIKGGETIIATF